MIYVCASSGTLPPKVYSVVTLQAVENLSTLEGTCMEFKIKKKKEAFLYHCTILSFVILMSFKMLKFSMANV